MKDLYQPGAVKHDAGQRLTAKYGTAAQQNLGLPMPDGDALYDVAVAVRAELHGEGSGTRPPADADDCVAALCLVDAARAQIDYHELVVIDAARAKGISWQRIGVALGHTEPTAERAATTRYGALLRRFPGHQPIETPATQHATSASTGDAR